MAVDIKLPDLGDGIESGDILEVLVSEGDVIQKDQGIVEIETEKATVEVPSPQAGRVTKVHVSKGQSVPVGSPLVTVEAEQPSGKGQQPPAAPQAEEAEEAEAVEEAEGAEEAQAEPEAEAAPKKAEPKKPPAAAAPKAEPPRRAAPSPPARPDGEGQRAPAAPEPGKGKSGQPDTRVAPAGPAVRRLAREVGVNLIDVPGSGPGGRITRDDVMSVVRQGGFRSAEAETTADHAEAPAQGEETADAWGPVEIQRATKIRRTIAAKMHESWSTVPRVTNFDDADVTEVERIRQASKADYAAAGIKLTSLPFVIKAVSMALRHHPLLNASLDLENEQIIYKKYINIGIAVDTPRGLVVPALRNADHMPISDIARALGTIAENARTNKFTLDDLRGSTFSISNLGAIGGAYSTPIVNTPEVAILLVGRSRKLPVVTENDQIVARLTMPLSLSYDHRLVDGAAAAHFLNDVIGYLEAPSRLFMAP